MSSLEEYFQTDGIDACLPVHKKFTLSSLGGRVSDEQLEITQRTLLSSNFSTRLHIYYIPDTDHTFKACNTIIAKFDEVKKYSNGVSALLSSQGEHTVGIYSEVIANRIFFYTERQLNESELHELDKISSARGLYITIRSKDYVKRRLEIEKPVAFISHDSRNKDMVARPLADGLRKRLCYAWYDEYSLKVGESLRESIERGIKEAKKCVLILTPEFLSNPGWGKTEFSSIFTRELLMNEQVILPIWHRVSKEDIYSYSPSLADRYALIWPIATDDNKAEYDKAVELLISRIHAEITQTT